MYRQASKKQKAYIGSLCEQLDVIDPTLYKKYRLEDAAKLIDRLQRKVDKKHQQNRQLKLL